MFIIVLIFGIANALNLYVPQDFSKKIDLNVTIKKYKNVKNIDFNNSLAIIKVDNIKTIFDENLTVIFSFDKTKRAIITHKKLLKDIKTITNIGLPEKILLKHLNSNYKIVKGALKKFLEKKIDAIVIDETTLKKLNENNFFVFKLEDFGIVLSKYFLVYDKKFFDYNDERILKIYSYFIKEFGSLSSSLVLRTVMFSNLYYNKDIKFYNFFWKKIVGDREKRKKTILKVGINIWEPFTIINKKEIKGIGIDFWKLVATKSNIKYKFVRYDSWLNLLKALKNKEIDVIVNTSETEDRKKYAVFSKPYISFPLGIICRNDKTFNLIEDITSIAVGKEFTAQKMMKKYYPNLNYVEVLNVPQALKLVQNKKVDCAVDILPVILWYINKEHAFNLQFAFETKFKFNVQFMLNSNYISLLSDINNAIDSITEDKKRVIVSKYIKSVVYKKEDNNFMLILFLIFMIIFLFLVFIKYLKVQKFSQIDPLTSIYNRRGILSRLKKIKKGAVLFMDLDHFKKVNDTYGHEFGDYVLQELGKILKNYIRDEDIVGRWGGEEFIMILSNVSFNDAMNVAERLKKTIENYDFNGKKITISIGVSKLKDNFKESLEKADEALYEAKTSGRNLVKGKE